MSQEQELLLESNRVNVKTILIVEDETQIVEFLERAISDETPCKSLAVSDGFEALKVTRDMRPNLFVLDYQDLWPKCLLLMESGILHIRLSVCGK